MDLIYANKNKEDIGVLHNYKLDMAYGFDENDFELSVNITNHVCGEGFLIYAEGTEYGGVIRRIKVKTATDELVYKGDTWHGILTKKILEPPAGEDYLICNGEANAVLAQLIDTMGLSGLYRAAGNNSGLTISGYQMHRYTNGYDGIKNMLSSVDGKLNITFKNGFVELSANPLVDYSQNDEFDSSQINFDVEKNYKKTNHVICLGQGDLKEREVMHLYADTAGNISETQTQFGLDEVSAVYENVNAATAEELKNGGIEFLQKAWDSDSLQVDFDANRVYDIGDIVGARENVTGIFVARPIIKKIVTIQNDEVKISHKVGEEHE